MVPSGPVRATLMIVFERPLQEIVVDHDLQGDLPQQRRGVLVAAVHLGPAALTAEPLGVADRQPRHLDLLQAPRGRR